MKPLLILCGLAVLFSSCDTSNESSMPPLLPTIQSGDMWVMKKTTLIGYNFPAPPISETVIQDTFRVTDITQSHGKTWYQIVNQEGNGLLSLFSGPQSYYAIDDDGIWQLDADSSIIQLYRYPSDKDDEHMVINGVFSSIVNPDTLYSFSSENAVPAIAFLKRYTTSFKPFDDGLSREEFKPLELERELTKNTYFSSELGVLRHEMFFVTVKDPAVAANVIGSLTWELDEYVPAGGQR